ncbi:MAG: hypothetical protein ACOY5Y_17260 [Pseudomonadota bacterium]|jgi:hypothetical protein
MGVFDDSMRKLAGGGDLARHLKPERLAGQYEIYEGYDDADRRSLAGMSRAARRRLEAALDREALAMGALGLAVGVAIGAAIMWRRGRSHD